MNVCCDTAAVSLLGMAELRRVGSRLVFLSFPFRKEFISHLEFIKFHDYDTQIEVLKN